jgi:hypothetical protein
MKAEDDAGDYTLVSDVATNEVYTTTTDVYGNPLVQGNYLFKVVSYNIASMYLGNSPDSAILTATLEMFTDAQQSVVSGTGIEVSYGASVAEVLVTCKDEDGAFKTEGGDILFLHV